MAIEREIWQQHIVEAIYAANPHLALCVNADQYVLAGKVVHIPQAGAVPAVVRNRSELPAAITRRTDTDITYAIDEYTTDPVHIPNAEKAELSYDKRESVLGGTQMALGEAIGVGLLYKWAPTASRLIKTTGEAIEAHVGKGKRKRLVLANLKAAQKQMDRDNLPTEGRYAMFDADMIDQLTDQLTATQYTDYSRAYDPAKGVIGELYGFKILKRSYVLSYLGLAVNAPETAIPDASSAAVICWHTSTVERALGDNIFFEDEGNPQYYGDIYSSLVRMGGRKRRADGKGVIAIVQAPLAEDWATGISYKESDFVTNGAVMYYCTEDHNASAAFATDKSKWVAVE